MADHNRSDRVQPTSRWHLSQARRMREDSISRRSRQGLLSTRDRSSTSGPKRHRRGRETAAKGALMADKEERVKVEKGLYQRGTTYWACATAPGQRTVRWKRIGPVGLQEARRERDKFAYKLKNRELGPRSRRMTVRQVSAEWLAHLDELKRDGELRPRTVASYEGGIRLHVLPQWASRDVSSVTADDLVAWYQQQRSAGAAAWSIRARWMALRGLMGHAARMGYIASNPCEVLTGENGPSPEGRERATSARWRSRSCCNARAATPKRSTRC